MKIYGAGLAGLITAQIMRMEGVEVHEAQESIPNNHAALLRFRTNAAEVETGIDFRKVSVNKAVSFNGDLYDVVCPIPAMNSYAQKCTGAVSSRSIKDLSPVERYIAPPSFISQLADKSAIYLGSPLDMKTILKNKDSATPMISTIPMPALMKIVGWETVPKFNSQQIWSLTCEVENPPTDVYQTIYNADQESEIYRVSLTGRRLIIECNKDPTEINCAKLIEDALTGYFGIHSGTAIIGSMEIKHQYYGKLLPINEQQRRSFILAMTEEYGIYSIGRFATWRQILLDDIINDVKIVKRFIKDKDNYQRSMASKSKKVN